MFITFEGIDGCGKTTQSTALEATLRQRGFDVVRVREPGGTGPGEALREILINNSGMETLTELFILCASRMELTRKVIEPALKAGKVVISDRYFDSSLVMQGHACGMEAWVKAQDIIALMNLPQPHATVLLDVDPAVTKTRMETRANLDQFESRVLGYHKRVRRGFLRLAESPEYRERFIVLDGNTDPEALKETIVKKVINRLHEIVPTSFHY